MFAIACSPDDNHHAQWLQEQIRDAALLSSEELDFSTMEALLIIVTPNTIAAANVLHSVSHAKQSSVVVYPILFETVSSIPWYLDELNLVDFTSNREQALRQFVRSHLSQQSNEMTMGQARDHYLNRATLKSPHTVSSYRRAIELFFEFLSDKTSATMLPIQRIYATPEDIPLTALGEADATILLQFAQWLLSPGASKSGDHRPYKAATVELRIAGIQNWLQFLDDYGWLSRAFPLSKAKRIVRDEMQARPTRSGPPRPPDHIEEVIYYYDTQQMPRSLNRSDANTERIKQWELTRLRNCALLHSLAETGGRISELLSLNLDNFPERYLNENEVLRIEVLGKGGHTYYLRFLDALPAIRAYIHTRGATLRATAQGHVPLFISHDSRYDGSRMSRIVAWRIVQRAAHALGLGDITPHDFRHWRATQLINAGQSLDVVQEYLGHRSVETTRAYYAHTDPLRVDEAVRNTRLPGRNEEDS